MKYHCVAKEIDSVIKDGTLLPNTKLMSLRLVYLFLIILCLIYVAAVVTLNKVFYEKTNIPVDTVTTLSNCSIIVATFFLGIVGVSFGISYRILMKTTSETNMTM